jgi:hypothetical protein
LGGLLHALLHAHSRRKEGGKGDRYNGGFEYASRLTSRKYPQGLSVRPFSFIIPVTNRKCIIHNRKIYIISGRKDMGVEKYRQYHVYGISSNLTFYD